jgi:hypothetical protein
MTGFVLFRGKKAFIFNIMIVVLTIVVLTYGYIRISEKTDVRKEIGENSLEMITRIQDGEKALIFLDFAAKMAVYQAVYDLQQQGGVSESGTCGTYYGFNRWNSESGQECFVDADTAKDSMRDLFVSSLVARVAAYPSADFVGNVPTAAFARGMALAASDQMGVSSNAPAEVSAPTCSGGEDYTVDFNYNVESGLFPDSGGRLWVPSQATCAGSYPLVVFLHGCMRGTHAALHKDFGDTSSTDILPLAKRLVQAGLSMPVIFAAPSQTRGTANYEGVPGSPCGESLWGPEFDPSRFVDLVMTRLPEGVRISSVSFIGHSEAGCSVNIGTQKALSDMTGLFAVGNFDSCAERVLGSSLRDRLGTTTKFLAVHSAMGVNRAEQDAAMNISTRMECPLSGIDGGQLGSCLKNETRGYFSFTMRDVSAGAHGKALLVGVEQFLEQFFPGDAVMGASPGLEVAEESAVPVASEGSAAGSPGR